MIDSVEVEFEPGLNVLTGETGAGKSILVEAVGLLLGRPRVRRPRAHRRGRSPPSRRSSRAAAKSSRPARNHRAGPQPRVHQRRAGDRRRAEGTLGRLIELHGQHEHQTLLDPARTSASSMPSAGSSLCLCRHSGRVRAAARASEDDLARLRARRRPTARRGSDLVTFQLAELDRAALKPAIGDEDGEDVELGAASGAGERRASRAVSATRATRRSTRATAPCWRRSAQVWRRVGELADTRPAVPAVSRGARRHQVAARGSRALSAPLRGQHRGLAGRSSSRWRNGWRCSSG